MPRKKQLAEDVEQAFGSAVRKAGLKASIRRGLSERVDAETVGKDILSDAVMNYVSGQVKEELCSKGYARSLTCRARKNSDHQIDYVVDVKRKQVIVGVVVTW